MPIPFKCPSCGGPLQYDGGDITVRCEFCTNHVIVPEELRAMQSPARGDVPLQDQLGKLAEIGRLIRDGQKIAAIKLYRETFGVGLKEAKDAVENLAAGRRVEVSSSFQAGGYQTAQQPYGTFQSPQQFTQSKGCSRVVWAFILPIFGLLVFGIGVAVYFFNAGGPRRGGVESVDTKPPETRTTPRTKQSKETSYGFARVVLKFGSDGIGAGQFKDARSVAFDGEGNIYAADYTGGRVQVFDANGKFLTQWMIDARMPLLRLAADRKGIVYIVQSGDINRYEGKTGKPLGKVPATGRWFNDVTVTADGGLVAVQDGQDIVRFDSSGRTVSVLKKPITEQSGDSELNGQVAVDGLGNVYELGTFNDAVFKFGPNGKYINRIGSGGDETGLFRAAHSIAVDGQGRVYVSDVKGIQVFDTNGRYLDVFKVEGNVAFGMVFNDSNELFVAARTHIVKFALNK